MSNNKNIKVVIKSGMNDEKQKVINFTFSGSGNRTLSIKDSEDIVNMTPKSPKGNIIKNNLGAAGLTLQFSSAEDVRAFKAELFRKNLIDGNVAAAVDNKCDKLVGNSQYR